MEDSAAAVPAGRRPAVRAMVTVAVALAIVLLVPNLYSDPNGLDPYLLRISGVSLALLVVALATRRLAATRLVLASVAAISLAWSAFLGTPRVLGLFGVHANGNEAVFWASCAQFAVTVVFAVAAGRAPAGVRPDLRLRAFGRRALAVTVAGILLFVVVVLIIPAQWLGREGLAPIALARDLPWLAPACALQAAAQELQFRGLLLGTLERVTSRTAANAGQAVGFGLAHLAIVYQGPVAPFIPVTMVLGLVLGAATQRTRSLWPAIVIHAVADIAVTAAVLPGLYGF
jgi:membrane protease YdiL (CAAX protease family)